MVIAVTAVSAPVAIALLAALAVIAIVVASVAIVQARSARATLRAHETKHRESVKPDRSIEAGNAPTGGGTAAKPAPAFGDTRSTTPVLVVEDEPGVRELIKRVLVRSGREVVAVAGPREALVALNRQPAIALMLVDVVMPDMDGYDLAVQARALSPGIHVVFMSAFARDPVRHPVGDSFLPKPFTTESLTAIVERALGGRSA